MHIIQGQVIVLSWHEDKTDTYEGVSKHERKPGASVFKAENSVPWACG